MDPKILLAQCQMILNQALMMGQVPIMFVMNDTTRRAIGDHIRSQVKESRMEILKRRLFKKPIPKLNSIFGLPVMESAHLPDFMISLQWAPAQNIEHGKPIATVGTGVNQSSAPENPFVQKDLAEKSSDEDKPVSLKDIAQVASNTPTVTDVLIRGLENAEAIGQVVVIRKYHNGDVDMSMSCNPDEAVGIVQKAQIWLAHNGH